MIVNGMAVARINMAHCDHEFVAKAMNMVRKICNEIDAEVYVAVWLDLNGPKVLGKLKIGSNRCDAG
jgi:pyruvate kinase